MHGVNDVRQAEIHRPGQLVPEPSAFEVEMAIVKLKRHKSPGVDQIPAELLKAGVEPLVLRSINVFIMFGIRTYCLRSGRAHHSTNL